MGLQFLRHIERTTVIAHLIDVLTGPDGKKREFSDSSDPTDEELRQSAIEQFEIIEHELGSFSEALLSLPRLVIFTKGDLPFAGRALDSLTSYFADRNLPYPPVLISAATGLGLEEVKEKLAELIKTLEQGES